METLTLKDMQIFKASFLDTIFVTHEDVREAARLLGYSISEPRSSDKEETAHANAHEWEKRSRFNHAVVLECSQEPRFWVGVK